jgi:hypothetical protein
MDAGSQPHAVGASQRHSVSGRDYHLRSRDGVRPAVGGGRRTMHVRVPPDAGQCVSAVPSRTAGSQRNRSPLITFGVTGEPIGVWHELCNKNEGTARAVRARQLAIWPVWHILPGGPDSTTHRYAALPDRYEALGVAHRASTLPEPGPRRVSRAIFAAKSRQLKVRESTSCGSWSARLNHRSDHCSTDRNDDQGMGRCWRRSCTQPRPGAHGRAHE